MFTFGVIAIEVWHTQFPVWAFVLALLICMFSHHSWILCVFNVHTAFIYTVPIGVIQAITNQQVGLNVITELIIGYLLPGRPVAMMTFKTWGYITMVQALNFTNDFKLGHYMKIPHRPMFFCQVVATIIAGTVQLGVQGWMFSNIEDLCSADQKDGFTCPSTTVFGTASIIVSFMVPPVAHQCSVCRVAVGCHWTAASVLARSNVLWPCLLLPHRRHFAVRPVCPAQEVEDELPQVPQLPAHLHWHGQPATRDSAQLRAVGVSLLHLQLRHPSAPLWLVGQVQL